MRVPRRTECAEESPAHILVCGFAHWTCGAAPEHGGNPPLGPPWPSPVPSRRIPPRHRRCGACVVADSQRPCEPSGRRSPGGCHAGFCMRTGGGVLPRRGDGDFRVRRSRDASLDPTTRSRSSRDRAEWFTPRSRSRRCRARLRATAQATGDRRRTCSAPATISPAGAPRNRHLVDTGEIENGHAAVHGIEEDLKGLAGQRPDDACSLRRARLRRDHDPAASRVIARS